MSGKDSKRVRTVGDLSVEIPRGSSLEPPLERKETPPPHRHRLRLALHLLWLIGILTVGAGAAVVFVPDEQRVQAIEDFLPIVYGPLITLLGTSFTWYYAGEHN
jgi:hypothetical protein